MKITSIRVFVACPGRNFVTVRIETDKGVHGVGDATLNGREMAVASYLTDHLAPCLIDMDPRRIEDIWSFLYKGAYWRKGPVTMTAIGAIDMALWDIKGKLADMPVYQLLGGASRDHVTLYAHANGETQEEVMTALGRAIDEGYRAVRLQCAVPGMTGTYGTLEGRKDYFELQGNRPLPPVQPWDTTAYLNFIPGLFAEARKRFGDTIALTHDVHSRLTPMEAAHLGKLLEPWRLTFLEDPMPGEHVDGYASLRQHSSIPIALGETFSTIWDAKPLIERGLIDYIRMAASHGGGITPLRRVADLAALYQIRTAPHGAPDLSPICHAAQAHINLWAPNFGLQEYAGPPNEAMQAIFPSNLHVSDGFAHPGDAPGLGIDYDEDAASAFPYRRSYLPVTRLKDGTMWDW